MSEKEKRYENPKKNDRALYLFWVSFSSDILDVEYVIEDQRGYPGQFRALSSGFDIS